MTLFFMRRLQRSQNSESLLAYLPTSYLQINIGYIAPPLTITPETHALKKVLYRVLRLVRRFFDWKLVPLFFRILFFPDSDSDAIAMLSGVILNGLQEANETALRTFA
jgi:hypothetical protein